MSGLNLYKIAFTSTFSNVLTYFVKIIYLNSNFDIKNLNIEPLETPKFTGHCVINVRFPF